MCVFQSLPEYWALPRLSGTVSESSVKDTIGQGVKGRGGEEWMAEKAGEDVLEGKERNQT